MILSIQDIYVSYGTTPVLTGVSFDVQKGESISIVGSNGSGKSTLLRSILRLNSLNSGQIEIFNENIHKLTGSKLRASRSRIGVVFQKHNLVPRLSVLSNVIHGYMGRASQKLPMISFPSINLWNQAFASDELRNKALKCLELVHLREFANRRADQLSGGQSQRVAIARALMQEPEIIFADEPVASLDPVLGEEVMTLFRQLCEERNITLLFTTHNIVHATAYADRVIAIKSGIISLDESTDSIESSLLLNEYE